MLKDKQVEKEKLTRRKWPRFSAEAWIGCSSGKQVQRGDNFMKKWDPLRKEKRSGSAQRKKKQVLVQALAESSSRSFPLIYRYYELSLCIIPPCIILSNRWNTTMYSLVFIATIIIFITGPWSSMYK